VYLTVPVAIPSMVQFDPTGPLAVYSPAEVMLPHLAIHVTGTLAVNCCVLPCAVLAEMGVITIGETIVMDALALPLPLVAVAVTLHVVVGYKGAFNTPAVETEPQVVFHVDGVLAVNCLVAFSVTVVEVGEMVTPKMGMQNDARQDRTAVARRKRLIRHQMRGMARTYANLGSIGQLWLHAPERLLKCSGLLPESRLQPS
jgi:hypothetical protein